MYQILEHQGLPIIIVKEEDDKEYWVSVGVQEDNFLFKKDIEFILPISPHIVEKVYPKHLIDKEMYDLMVGTRLSEYGIPISVYLLCPGGLSHTRMLTMQDVGGKEYKVWFFTFVTNNEEEANQYACNVAEQILEYQSKQNYGLFNHLEYLA